MKRIFFYLVLLSVLLSALYHSTQATKNSKKFHLKELNQILNHKRSFFDESSSSIIKYKKEKHLKKKSDELSSEQRKKIDQASETAFKKLKNFYIVASRSR